MYFKPASSIPLADLLTLVNKVFEGYGSSAGVMTTETLPPWCEKHFIDLKRGYIFYEDGDDSTPVAFSIMAHRDDKPGQVRLVAMGCLTRGKGHGYKGLKIVEEQERLRGSTMIELECRNTNPAGMALYKKGGYEIFKELPGWKVGVVDRYGAVEGLEEIDVGFVQGLVKEHASRDLPWQAWDFETNLPLDQRGYKLGEAYCVIGKSGTWSEVPSPPANSNEEDAKEAAKTIKLATLIVPPSYRGQGHAKRLVEALMGRFKGHQWEVPALFPRDVTEGFAKEFGATEVETILVQMRREL